MLKSVALQILGQKIAACTRCGELAQYRADNGYQTVPGVGAPNARVMAIGEAPGENEAKQGEPFVGRAGTLLDNIFKAAGWRREDVFIANCVKCRPPGNREPSDCELANCRKFLDMQIRCVNPEWIICFGRVAATHLLGKDGYSLGSLRGQVHDYNGHKVVCTWHPSYILQCRDDDRRKEAKRELSDDIYPVVEALRSPVSEV